MAVEKKREWWQVWSECTDYHRRLCVTFLHEYIFEETKTRKEYLLKVAEKHALISERASKHIFDSIRLINSKKRKKRLKMNKKDKANLKRGQDLLDKTALTFLNLCQELGLSVSIQLSQPVGNGIFAIYNGCSLLSDSNSATIQFGLLKKATEKFSRELKKSPN